MMKTMTMARMDRTIVTGHVRIRLAQNHPRHVVRFFSFLI